MAGLLGIGVPARAQQGPEKGGHEVQFWTGGGHSSSGGAQDIPPPGQRFAVAPHFLNHCSKICRWWETTASAGAT